MAVIGMAALLMIVNNLHVRWSWRAARPLEANSPLVVNANTVLTLAVADQSFEAIARQSGKVPERCGRLQTVELQARGALESRECLDPFPRREAAGPFVAIAKDH